MATPIIKIINDYCAEYIDDIRLQELAESNPALYARRAWGYLNAGLPFFNTPPNMPIYLMGDKNHAKLKEPKYDTHREVIEEEQTSDYVIALGAGYAGYEVFSARVETEDDFGNIILTPTDIASYDETSGDITISASVENPIAEGTVFDFDFYKDGEFEEDLSPEIMHIIGLCFGLVWEKRFMQDWLSMTPKVEDKSFSEQNRANKIRADSERYEILRKELASEMRRLTQSYAYRKTFSER